MSSFEFNKIFAAILVAGIVAMLSGFVAELLTGSGGHGGVHAEPAFAIDGGAVESGGSQAAAGPEPVLSLIATADVSKGEKLSKACAACHDFTKGGANKVGPGLWGVVGADKGHHAGFAYSEDLIKHGGKWDYREMNKFLWKPKALIAGTKMSFAGLKKPEDRAAVIAWLRTLSDSPAALPAQGEIDAEIAELAPPAAETVASPAGTEAPAAADSGAAVTAPDTQAATPQGETPAPASPATEAAH